MNGTIINILSFLLTLGILVFVHEAGHYLAARALKVGVKRFSIGFGPKIYSIKDKHNTNWQIAAIPLGGFVEMEGEFGRLKAPEINTPANHAESLSLGGRAIIALAGPLANLLFAVLAVWIIFVGPGEPTPGKLETQGFGSIIPGSAAEAAGLQKGDIPLSVNGKSVFTFNDFVSAISASQQNNPPREIELIIKRQSQQQTFRLTPRPTPSGRLIVGVGSPQGTYTPLGPVESIGKAVTYVATICLRIFQALSDIISTRDVSQLAGPIQIAQISASAASGGIFAYLSFLSLFSINLAVFNLLPIPALDGGYLLLFAMAKIFNRNFADRVARIAIPIGVVFLMVLMALIILREVWSA